MKADTKTIEQVLHGDRRFVVPVYQRPYVWERERQWEPLWEDVETTAARLATARVEGHAKGEDPAHADKKAAPHFLGAIVIEQSPTATGDVDTRLIVDGQQRMTTLQLLLRGALDAIEAVDAAGPTRAKLRKAIRNDPEVVTEHELLKVTPRRAEQADFVLAMEDTPPDEGDSLFAAARAFFRESAAAFLLDGSVPVDPYTPVDSMSAEGQRAALLVAALLGLVKLVVIDLEDVDDAQVIFEALNARNTPLSATDLVKNLLFLRAQAEGQDPDQLYETLWKRFDDDGSWWLEQVGVGHAQRARQDWLLGDWLIAQRGSGINVGRLYGEFRGWLDSSGTNALNALTTLNRYADAYEVLNGRKSGASEAERTTFRRLERLNITAATPVLLWLFVQSEDRLSRQERELAVMAVDSYLVRRMAAKYQTRAYGQAFVEVLKAAQSASAHPGKAVIEALRASPHGYEWPDTNALEAAFVGGRYYGPGGINQDRLRLLLGAIDHRLQGLVHKSESVTIDYGGLTIEHVIPQTWQKHWPVVVADQTLLPLAEAERNQHVNRVGNLTLTVGPLNSALSNNPWDAKRAELQKHSKLELNARLVALDTFDETRINQRGAWLAAELNSVWPGPADLAWSG